MASLLAAASAACADVRAAGPDDGFAGCVPAVRAAPASTAELGALLAATAPLGATVGVRAGGTQAGLGAPARSVELLVDTCHLDAVLEYDPGDLVVRAQAGVTLAALGERLAAERQFLALDPASGSTLGGVVATAAAGPRRHRYGSVRDLLIGVTFVLADGTCAKAGGKVVKNVAGYDLCKLLAGSLGTLAVVTEVTLRVHPAPAASGWVTVPLRSAASLGPAVEALLASRLDPTAVEVDLAGAAGTLAMLFEGLPEAVPLQVARAASLLGGAGGGAPPDWWGRHPWDAEHPVGVRVACAPARVPAAVAALERFADGAPVRVRGRAAVGVLEAGVARPDGADGEALARLRSELDGVDGTAVVTALPAAAPEVDRWGPVRGLELMRAVKDRFDPGHRLAPGRFVGGI
jgi:glycolate oxidase FAD binding subunit